MTIQSHERAVELTEQWKNGNRDYVMQELAKLSGIVAAAVAARMVLLLHDDHALPTDLALFSSRLESTAYQEVENRH